VPAGERAATVGVARAEAAGLRLVCTGVLVAPDVVLTAGHCVDDIPLADLSLYMGDGVDGGLVATTTKIAAVHVSPHLRRHPLGYSDVAALRLDAPLQDTTPTALSRNLNEDDALTSAGQAVT